MQKLMMTTVAMVAAASVATGFAQSKTVPVKMEVMTATVDTIDRGARQVTVTKSDGKHEVFYVPASVKRFDTLKVGDKITAKYYENIVVRLKLPGEKGQDSGSAALTPTPGAKPGGTLAAQRTITATITAIDPKVPSISFSGPNGYKYSSRVEDTEALKKVKVGDRLDITWTTAVLISVDAPK